MLFKSHYVLRFIRLFYVTKIVNEIAEVEMIRRVVDDMATLKEQMNRIEITVNEIDMDIHKEVNPDYIKKLEEIQMQKGVRFKTAEEFEAYFSE
ncbi:MAG: hypothetical protein KAT05_16120 [Spirochaetes bacterium]|nr:hypothetical protein [Spirochaetota bacterium]